MALQATFTADFAKFDSAVKAAADKLGRTFEVPAKGVASSLERMSKAFAGDKIIRDANLTAAAIQKIGGVSRLTESEQRRVNATVTEAIEKYKALGREAPAELTKLAGETGKVNSGLLSLVERSKTLQSVLAGGVAGAVAVFAQAALNAAVAVGKLAIEGIGELVRRGGEVAPVREGFVRLSGGIAEADKALAIIRTNTRGLVTDFDAMQAANKAMLLGVTRSGEEMGKLAQTAAVLGRAMGQDATKSLDDLITALGRSSPLILDNLGLTVSVAKANETYAAQLGKTADSLTDAEKKQAFMNAALTAAKARVEELGGITLTFADRLTIVSNQFRNFTDALAVGISQSPVLNAILERVGEAMTRAFGENQVALVQGVINIVNRLAIGVVAAAEQMLVLGDFAARGFAAVGISAVAGLSAVLQFATGVTQVAGALSAIGRGAPGGLAFQGIGKSAEEAAAMLVPLRDAMRGMADETARTIVGQGSLNTAMQKSAGFLSGLRAELEKAAGKSVSFDAITRALTEAQGGLAKAAGQSADEIGKLADRLSGADLAREVNNLQAAFNRLTPAQKANADVIQRVLDAYEPLRQQLRVLPKDLEALRTANQKLLASYDPLRSEINGIAIGALPNMNRAAAEAKNAMLGLDKNGLLPVSRSFAGIAPLMLTFKIRTQDIAAQMGEAERKFLTFREGLSQLSQAFGTLAQVSGGAFGEISEGIGRIVASVDLGIKAGQQFVDGFLQAMRGGAKNIASGLASLATGLVSGFGAILSATQSESLVSRLVGGASTGAAVGASIGTTIGASIASSAAKGATLGGIWGAAAGAIVGIMIAVFRGRATRREMEIVGKEWGQSISKGLFDQIKRDQAQFRGDRVAASVFNLDAFISEAGGINDLNFDKFLGKLRDVFVMLETGKFTSRQALQVIADNFDAFAQHVVESGRLASAEFVEIIRLNASSRLFSPEILNFVSGAAGRAAAGLAGMLAPITKEADKVGERVRVAREELEKLQQSGTASAEDIARAQGELNEAIRHQGEVAKLAGRDIENIGLIALSTFNQARAAGVSFVDALNAIGPSLDALIRAQEGLGITGENAALQQLIRFRELANQFPEVVAAAGSLNETMVALSQIGGLNTETLLALEEQGVRTFNRLVDAGFSEQQALAQIAKFLQNVIQRHHELGLPIDDNIGRLIDMADQYGLLTNEGETMADTLKGGFKSVVDAINNLIRTLGGVPDSMDEIGRAAERGAERARDALRKIPNSIPINIDFNIGDLPDDVARGNPVPDVPSFANGGVGNFGRGTLAMLHGREAIIPLDRMSARPASQTIVIELDGEVLTRTVVQETPSFLRLRNGRARRT